MSSEHEQWMRMAIGEAEKAASEGNMAVGAVIVHGGFGALCAGWRAKLGDPIEHWHDCRVAVKVE